MKKYKPLFDRLVVFSVPIRRRIEGSMLYRASGARYAFSRAEEIWILAAGPECKDTWIKGTHAWLNDSFELEPTDLDLWPQHENEPEFARLRDFVQSVDGDVKTSIVKEGAILAVDDEYEAQSVLKTMPKD